MKFKFSSFSVLSFLTFAMLAAFIAKVPAAQAATVFLTPSVGLYQIGQTFDVEMRIDSLGQTFNAAQATIQFPPGVLRVKSLDFSSPASVFNFWLVQPSFSNTDGQITFIGGSTSGLSGSAVGVLKVTFTATAAGDAPLSVSDAAITASDGSGSNILSSIVSAQFSVVPSLNAPKAPTPAKATTTPSAPKPVTVIPAPTPIVRKPMIVKNLPLAPVVNVPLYPEPKKWYNSITNFLAQWDLPADISGVSTAINQNSKFALPMKSEGLFDSKVFMSLGDGAWYLHVMFQNNIGWGPVTDYRIGIDSVPPLPFTISALESNATDSPIRTLEFKTSDGLSGMDHYSVRVDGSNAVNVASGTLTLAPLAPGQHNVSIQAVDAAGNIRENNFQFTINPIASPLITSFSKNVYAQISDLLLGGMAVSDASISLVMKDKNGAVIGQTSANADHGGSWAAKLNGPFRTGEYYVEATAKDSRGAFSLPVKTEIFSVREKPLFVIWSWEITQLWFFIFIGAVILIFGIATRLAWRRRYKQAGRKAIIAERDVNNMIEGTDENLDKMLHYYDDGKIDDREAAEAQFLLKQTKSKLKKAKKYITDNIDEIND